VNGRQTIAARMVRRLLGPQGLITVKFTLADIETFIQQSRQGPSANA